MKSWGTAVFAGALVIACSSSEGGSSGSSGSSGQPAVPDVPDREIAKKEIGPEGGTLTGEAITIEVPPGAVTEKKIFAINGIAETRVGLPLRVKANKPGAYALLPDDVEFLKPVTLRITLDKAKLDEVGPGGIAAFRSEPVTNNWVKKDSKVDETKQLVVQTTHFSWWTDGSDSDASCITNRKGCNSEPTSGTDPAAPLKVDCRIPFDGKGVHCKGTGPNGTAPYECRCSDTPDVIKTFQRVPDDKFIEETAKSCGATCPPIIPPGACIDAKCEGGKPGEAWSCKTERLGIAISCSFTPGKSATCACKDGVSFPIAGGPSGVPSANDLQEIMSAKCAVVDCSPPGVDAGAPPPPPPEGWVCISPAPTTPPGKGCEELSMYTCRDGHYYDSRCPANQPGPQQCECLTDGVVTKTVTGSCEPLETWRACGFPRLYGE